MAKGNDGSAARRRTQKKLMIAAGLSFIAVTLIVCFGGSGGETPLTPEKKQKHHPSKDDHHHKHKHHHSSHVQDNEDKHHKQKHQYSSRVKDDDNKRKDDDDDHQHGDGGSHHYFGKYLNKEASDRLMVPHDAADFHHFGKRRHRNIEDSIGHKMKDLDWHHPVDDKRNHNGADDDDDDGTVEISEKYRRDLIETSGSKPKKAEKALEGILNGSLNLVSISNTHQLVKSEEGVSSYSGVFGKFCKLNFKVHKEDPSSYPMFRFMLQASPGCENPVTFDLHKVAHLARERDRQSSIQEDDVGPKVLNLTAVAFHESRCGSTLVANSIIAMDPEKHRVYSESPPPVGVFHICGDHFERCRKEQAASILKDTIYLMSRTDDHREERVFFKFQSITSKSIPIFQMAFPEVPWMYVYRDPVQVMMSHVKDDPKLKRAICTKTRRSPPLELTEIAKRHGRDSAFDLEPAEYCAAHLAQLTEAAVRSLDDLAIPLAYDRLPSILWEKIFPNIFGRPLEAFEVSNLQEISKSYSKQGKGKPKEGIGEFKGDSEEKEKKASDEVREAAKEFLNESFDQLAAFDSKFLK